MLAPICVGSALSVSVSVPGCNQFLMLAAICIVAGPMGHFALLQEPNEELLAATEQINNLKMMLKQLNTQLYQVRIDEVT